MLQNPFAVSTWSVHHQLGLAFHNGPGQRKPFAMSLKWGPGELRLEQLPQALAMRGYQRAEICHFHLASLDPVYLGGIREAFQQSGVVIQTLLIDDGDITDPETRERDMAWISDWIVAAGVLDAENARVIAGKQKPADETLAMSVAGLTILAALGKQHGVRVVTENWFDLTASPGEVFHLLDAVGDDLGFLADTGNWSGPTKYADLAAIFARAELCHAKADFSDGLVIDAVDFRQCIAAAQRANYRGPLTLVFESKGDEWQGIALERSFIQQHQKG